jgi:hypothetical protein
MAILLPTIKKLQKEKKVTPILAPLEQQKQQQQLVMEQFSSKVETVETIMMPGFNGSGMGVGPFFACKPLASLLWLF